MKTAVAVEDAAVAPWFGSEKKSSRRNTAVAVKDAAVAPIIQEHTAVAVGVPRSRRVHFLRSPDFLPRIISLLVSLSFRS